MPTDVVMPQMGESIAEGTIVRWIKKLGDQVARDEPLFEISTDKVDAEIPSPAAGVLSEIRVKEGETVAVNSVVAVIGQSARERRRSRSSSVAGCPRRRPPPVRRWAPVRPSVAAPPPSAAPSPAVTPSSAGTPPRSDEMIRAGAPQPPLTSAIGPAARQY